MKILFIGCVKSSYCFLSTLISEGAQIVGVITKKEAGINSDFEDLTPLCAQQNIDIIYVDNINNIDAINFIKKVSPDIGYCMGWSQLIKENVINLFPRGVIGYHPAALPHNKGRHPIIWALVLGLNTTASSFFRIEKTADTGDILSQVNVDIDYNDDAMTLMDKMLKVGKKQLVNLTRQLENGCVNGISQKEMQGNTWRKRGQQDGKIDWRMSSNSIYNLVRGLTRPYVGAHFIYKDKEIKVWKVRECLDEKNEYTNIEPGKIIDIDDISFTVKAGDNLVKVIECDEIELQIGEYL